MIFHPLLDLLGQNNVHHNTDDDWDDKYYKIEATRGND